LDYEKSTQLAEMRPLSMSSIKATRKFFARACSIVFPKHVDFISSAFFSKTHFNSLDWKQVNKSSIQYYA